MLKKIGIGVLILVVLIVAAAYAVPKFYPWNDHKADIAAQVKAATGRDLVIDGDISADLLPTPTLSVSRARLANAPGGSTPDMVSFEALKVRVALMPLLDGDIKVESIVLEQPSILLEQYPNGTANWELAMPADGAAAPTPAAETGGTGSLALSLDKITIEKGRILYRNADGDTVAIEDIDADLSARSLQGPFAASGTATIQGIRTSFEVNSGTLAPEGQIPLGLALALPDADSRVMIKGTFDQSGGAAKLSGHVAASAAKLGAALARLAPDLAAGLPLDKPFSFEGDVVASAAAAELDQARVQLGDTTATGTATAERGGASGAPWRVAATLAVNKLDLDALAGPAGAVPAASGGPPAAPAPAFSLPGGFEAGLDLTVDAISYRNAVINKAHLAGKLEDGQLKLTQLAALLPGNTDVTLTGTVSAAADGVPQFAGAFSGRSDNIRTLLEWLQVPLPAIPSDRLHKFAMTSQVSATPLLVQISQMDLTIDTTRAAGGVTVAMPKDGQGNPAFGVGLAIDQINLDGYMPPAAPAPAGAGGAPSGGLPLDALKPLAAVNANAQLKIGSLTYNAQTIQNLLIDGSLADGTLTLKELSVGDFAGGSGKLSGTLSDLGATPRFDTKIDLAAKDAARALRFAGLTVPATATLGAMKLAGSLAGGTGDVAYDLTFSIAGIGAQGQAKGTANGLTQGVPRVDSTFALSAKDAAPLLVIAGLGAEDQPRLGALSIDGTAVSGTDDVTYDIGIELPDLGGDGKLKGKLTGLSGTPSVDTALDLSAKKPAPLLALAGFGGTGLDKLGALKVAGTLAGNATAMKLDLGVDALGGAAKVAGTVGLPPEGGGPAAPQLDLAIEASHPELRQLITAFAGTAAPGPKIGAFALSTHARSAGAAIALTDLKLAAGPSEIAGSATYESGGARPKVTADLKANAIPLAALAGGGGKEKGSGGGGPPWSREPMDLSMLTGVDADLTLAADALILESGRVDGFVGKLALNDGVLTITQLSGKTRGGGIDLKGEVHARGVPSAALTVAATHLEIGELVDAGGMRVQGPVSVNGDFKASGVSMAEMIDTLSGKGRLDGSVTVLSESERIAGGGLLGAVGLPIKQLTGITDIVGTVVGGYVGRASKLSGNFVVERGILTTQDTVLANEAAKALAHGKVNLSAWTLDMLTDFYRGTTDSSPWLSMALTGRLDAPNVRLAGLAFSPENLVPGALEGLQAAPHAVIDQVVPGLMQGLQKAGSGAAGAVTQPVGTLQDAVQGILGGSSAQPPPAAQPGATTPTKKKQPAIDELVPEVKGLFGQ
jgi:uncharacterized protein involved in outer membrane biogenesis